jgi:hypothetical protein
MEMPVLNDAHKKLEKLVGDWEGEETIFPSPFDSNGGKALARVRNVLALDGFAVIQDYEQQRHADVNFHGHGVFTWNAGINLYSMLWFDSFGLPPVEYRGTFDNNVLVLLNHGAQGFTRATFNFSQPGRYTFQQDVSPDEKQWFPFLEGNYALKKVSI